ncbi:MAG: hypothetical protein M3O15_04180, partial [Acidobacteriota bacterium]|nr:hypothetical protein [Acidobacteriota bacterium]
MRRSTFQTAQGGLPGMQWNSVQLGPTFLRVAIPAGLILFAAGLTLTTRTLDEYNRSIYPLAPAMPFNARTVLPTAASSRIGGVKIPVELTILRGETVAQVFHKLGLTGEDARAATEALAGQVDVRGIKAGNRCSALLNPDLTLASLHLTLEGAGRLAMTRQAWGWQADWRPFQRSSELRALRGMLGGSLEASIRRAGGPAELAYRMADTLQWDLDFSRDLRGGDQFEVLYEEVQMDGAFHALGNILALVYDNQGRRHEAYRYGDSGVYYDGQGTPLR